MKESLKYDDPNDETEYSEIDTICVDDVHLKPPSTSSTTSKNIPLLFHSFFGKFLMIVGSIISVAGQESSICPRYASGSSIIQPLNLYSSNGYLDIHLSYQTVNESDGIRRFCYMMPDHLQQSPTLRVKSGDHLLFTVKNELPNDLMDSSSTFMDMNISDPCGSMSTKGAYTRVHFHGYTGSPTCHQDDSLKTFIDVGDEFTYDFEISDYKQPAGLYWYHPHPHGRTEAEIQGGGAGVIIVEGIENIQPAVAGLVEEIFVVRDILLPDGGDDDTPVKPAWDISVNFIPITYPTYEPAIFQMKPNEKQFWRFLNAGADLTLDMQLLYDDVPQTFQVVGQDSVVYGSNGGTTQGVIIYKTHLSLGSAERVEVIVIGPNATVKNATLITNSVYTGPEGDVNPTRPLFQIQTNVSLDYDDKVITPLPSNLLPARTNDPILAMTPATTRTLVFSEDDDSFFLTEEGHDPTIFNPGDPFFIDVLHGTVEDWIVENQSGELHRFHAHQLHFLLLERNGAIVDSDDQQYMDTVEVPYIGDDVVSSVKVRMDFTGNIVGKFMAHCHISEHSDKGMVIGINVMVDDNNNNQHDDDDEASSSSSGEENRYKVATIVESSVIGSVLVMLVCYLIYTK